MHETRPHGDVNAVIGGYLRDLAFAQASPQKMYGYKRAAAAILGLDEPLTELVRRRRHAAANPGNRSWLDANHHGGARGRSLTDGRARDRAE